MHCFNSPELLRLTANQDFTRSADFPSDVKLEGPIYLNLHFAIQKGQRPQLLAVPMPLPHHGLPGSNLMALILGWVPIMIKAVL